MNTKFLAGIIKESGLQFQGGLKSFRMNEIKPMEHYLIDAVRKGARDIIEVTINEGKALKAISGQIKTLYTHGLCGCQGTLVLTKCRDGKPFAILTHFDPLSVGANVNRLKQLVREYSSIIDPKVTPKVFFSVPGEWAKNGEKYEQVVKRPELLERVKTGLKEALGEFEETIMPYSEIIQRGESRALIANFASDNSNKVSIQSVGNHYKNVEL